MSSLSLPEYDLEHVETGNRLAGLWQALTGYRWLYLWATLAMGLAAVAKSGTYLMLRHFIDNVLGAQNVGGILLTIALSFVGLAFVEGGFIFLSRRAAARTAEGVAYRLRNYMFDHIQHLSFTYHDRSQTGELIQRSTSDVDAMRRFFADEAIMAGRIVMLFAVNLVALLFINVKLALLSVVVMPVIVAMSVYFFKHISDAYEGFQEQEATLSTTLQENLSGVRVVKAFARQDYEREKFNKDSWEQYRRGRHLLMLHALFWPISDILASAQMLGGFFLAAVMTINGEITVGTYLAYAGMVIWIIWPMRNLGRVVVQMSVGMVSFGRLLDIMRERREPLQSGTHNPNGGLRGKLEFDDVCFAYESNDVVLNGINFKAEPGQVIALMGPTGSGKSTLINMLPRFYDYNGGSIKLDGVELRDYPRYYLRRQIGIVEQEPFLFSRTIRDNIALGVDRKVTQEEIEEAARAAALHDVILTFPEGYDTLVGERGVTLSGGQKQRVAIARTLLKDPCILILDDATSSVDTETEGEIREALQRLMKDRTTFIIAHRIQSVAYADLILVLDGGQIVQQGMHDTLMEQDGIYRQIYQMQARIETDLQEEMSRVGLH